MLWIYRTSCSVLIKLIYLLCERVCEHRHACHGESVEVGGHAEAGFEAGSLVSDAVLYTAAKASCGLSCLSPGLIHSLNRRSQSVLVTFSGVIQTKQRNKQKPDGRMKKEIALWLKVFTALSEKNNFL